jgi:ribosomal protein L40E
VPNSEQKLGIIKDILLPLDVYTRYDVYFTDKRIAIVCMGKAHRVDQEEEAHPYLMSQVLGGPPPAASNEDSKNQRKQIEEEIEAMALDDILRISRKSCFYTYGEIEKVKLVPGRKPKFTILSKECISKFMPNQQQLMQLYDLLPRIEMLKDKLLVFSDSQQIFPVQKETPLENPSSTNLICNSCGFQNDSDAIFCQSCGIKIRTAPYQPESSTDLICSSCGTKNKKQSSFCKKCGRAFSMSIDNKP